MPPATPDTQDLQIYMVGGAVRDRLLGLPVQDRDWVVVGATPQAMSARGFVPVGKDFPVFLHPDTHEEYALARTERKSGRGYKGFTVYASADVTLAEDLARRDLTINAIAAPAGWPGPAPGSATPPAQDDPALADPYGGQRDLRLKVLRHVTDAFAEDPVRILRLARFAARFHDFSIAPETAALLRRMVAAGEADHLVPERVWQELARGLMQTHAARMLDVLHACTALPAVLPALAEPWAHAPTRARLHRALRAAATLQAPWPVRWACLLLPLMPEAQSPAGHAPAHLPAHLQAEAAIQATGARLRVPTEGTALASLLARERQAIHHSLPSKAPALLQLLQRCDALRRPERFAHALLACECDARSHAPTDPASDPARDPAPYPPRPHLLAALAVVQGVDTASAARQAQSQGAHGPAIGQAIDHARTQALAQWLAQGAPQNRANFE